MLKRARPGIVHCLACGHSRGFHADAGTGACNRTTAWVDTDLTSPTGTRVIVCTCPAFTERT